MAFITTIPLFKNTAIGDGSAGGTSNSDAIDLREVCREGKFALSYKIGVAGIAATAATTNFYYLTASELNGTFVAPASDSGVIGTAGSASGSCGIQSFSPVLAPFMKIQAKVGTSGTAKVTAELHVL